MKTCIEVKDRKEAEAIKRALDDPTTRALVLTTGYLLAIPTDRGRKRVLNFVADKLDEERNQP